MIWDFAFVVQATEWFITTEFENITAWLLILVLFLFAVEREFLIICHMRKTDKLEFFEN